jgi:hypothetical protein
VSTDIYGLYRGFDWDTVYGIFRGLQNADQILVANAYHDDREENLTKRTYDALVKTGFLIPLPEYYLHGEEEYDMIIGGQELMR